MIVLLYYFVPLHSLLYNHPLYYVYVHVFAIVDIVYIIVVVDIVDIIIVVILWELFRADT